MFQAEINLKELELAINLSSGNPEEIKKIVDKWINQVKQPQPKNN